MNCSGQFTNAIFINLCKYNTHSNVVLDISKTVCTSEKLNGKNKKTK